MTAVHPESASAASGHASPTVAVLAGAFLVLCTVLPLAVVARSACSARRALRGCPVCGDCAVRVCDSARVNYFEALVVAECGQCGTWRRHVVNQSDEHAHVRRLERDRRRIRRRLRRLETRRRELDMHAFIVRLRSEIGGAEDFLASTRPPAAVRPVRHRRPPGNG